MIQPDRFFVDFTSSKGRTQSWTPHNMMFSGTLAKMKKLAIKSASDMIDASYGREDWSFKIYATSYQQIGDPNLMQHGFVKAHLLYTFD